MASKKPYAEIRRAVNGEFYSRHIGLNGESLKTSETQKNKADIIEVEKFYYPNFVIKDLTHLRPLKSPKYNIILT